MDRRERLQRLIDEKAEGNQALLSQMISRTPSVVWQYLNGHRVLGEKLARHIEERLRLPPGWLDHDHGEEPSNVSTPARALSRVPLISWVSAGQAREPIDLYHPGDAEAWVETSVQVRAHTFALRVEGDSMAPEFLPGALIVVEPELDPQPGNYVIARNGEGEVTFKQLVRDGADWYLKPLNERYPIKPLGGAKILGVVREQVRRYR